MLFFFNFIVRVISVLLFLCVIIFDNMINVLVVFGLDVLLNSVLVFFSVFFRFGFLGMLVMFFMVFIRFFCVNFGLLNVNCVVILLLQIMMLNLIFSMLYWLIMVLIICFIRLNMYLEFIEVVFMVKLMLIRGKLFGF